MKKIFLPIVVLLLLALTACGGDIDPEALVESASNAAEEVVDSVAEEISEITEESVEETAVEEEVPAATEEEIAEGGREVIDISGGTVAMIENTDVYYRLQNMLTEEDNKCLEGQGGAAPGSGAVLDGAAFINDCQNVTGQLWKLTLADNGYYRLQNMIGEEQNLCLEGNRLAEESLLSGASVMMECQNASGQFWQFVDAGNGYFHMQTEFLQEENKCLEGQGGAAPGSGAVLDGAAFMDDCQNVTGQLWKLVPEGASETDAGAPVETFTVDPTQPIDVEDDSGTQVSIGPDVLVDENGNPATGELTLNMNTDEGAEDTDTCGPELIVWSYNPETGLWEEEGLAPVQDDRCVKSVGTVAVEVTDDAGNEYDLDDGATAEVSISCEPAPDEVLTVWSYNSQTGLWEETGTQVLEQDGRCSADVGDLGATTFAASEPQMGTLTGQAVDATTGTPLAEGQVCIQGTDQCTAIDSNGNYTFADLPAGDYTLAATASGYFPADLPFTVAAGETATQNMALSPEIVEGDIRIVLTWGEAPLDLDSHLWVPTVDGLVELFYENPGNQEQSPFAGLDVDDTSSYGPETTTITERSEGTFTYAIYNYSGTGSFATSEARIQVYGPTGLIAEFTPPADPDGRWWYVFDMYGDSDVITEVNRLQNESPVE